MTVKSYIQHLLKTDYRHARPRKINWGECDKFANSLVNEFPKGEALWGDCIPDEFEDNHEPDAHCFFRLEGKYYYAECTEGVSTPKDLPFYIRQKKHLIQARANSKYASVNPFPTVNGEIGYCP